LEIIAVPLLLPSQNHHDKTWGLITVVVSLAKQFQCNLISHRRQKIKVTDCYWQ